MLIWIYFPSVSLRSRCNFLSFTHAGTCNKQLSCFLILINVFAPEIHQSVFHVKTTACGALLRTFLKNNRHLHPKGPVRETQAPEQQWRRIIRHNLSNWSEIVFRSRKMDHKTGRLGYFILISQRKIHISIEYVLQWGYM